MTNCSEVVPDALVNRVAMIIPRGVCLGTGYNSIGNYAGRLWQSEPETGAIRTGFKCVAEMMSSSHAKTYPDYRYQPGQTKKKGVAHVKRPPNHYMLFVAVVSSILKSSAGNARPPVLCNYEAVNAMCASGPAAYLPSEAPSYFATDPFEPSPNQLH